MTHDRDLDSQVRTWLEETPPGPPDRDAVHARVMDRLPETHQRRHWWPFRWNPLAAGATRSADAGGPHPAGRSRTMFNATRMVAASAILALVGSLALVGGNLGPSSDPVGVPGAEEPNRAPAHFEQTVRVRLDQAGVPTEVDGVSQLHGVVTSYLAQIGSDSRVTGIGTFTFDGAEYLAGVGPVWGTFRLQNEDGAWEGPFSGMARPDQTRLSGWLVGEGAYESMSQYRDMIIDHRTTEAVITGLIIPGDPPPKALTSD